MAVVLDSAQWLFQFSETPKKDGVNQTEIANALFGDALPSVGDAPSAPGEGGGDGGDPPPGGAGPIIGTAGADRIFGSETDDEIFAGAGNDKVFAGPGDDIVYGGDGKDRLFGGDGDDHLFGGDGRDKLWGDDGDDKLFGEDGADKLWGGAGDDELSGGVGKNTIDGGAGDADVLLLSGAFADYSFSFNDDGSVYVEGAGERSTVTNVELVRDNTGNQTEIAYTLQILHASDLEGGVDAIGRAANFSALVDAFEDEFANSILLSAGDNYIPGPFFGAASDRSLRDPLQAAYQELFDEPGLTNIRELGGRVDITIMNILGFDASAVGNHEFDAGPDAFENIIESDVRGATLGDIRWLGAQFPYLSANIDFSNEPNLANLFTPEILNSDVFGFDPAEALAGGPTQPRIAPATIITEGDEQIGVVGATTQLLETITSVGGATVKDPDGAPGDDMTELAAILQPVVDSLVADGVNKIILVSHLQQIALETELAGLLNGVDVIIAGGSDTLLADQTDVLRPGDVAQADYPQVVTKANGENTLIVSTDGEYSYLGRLVVDFDANGNVVLNSIDEVVSGAYATTDDIVAGVYGAATAEEAIAQSGKATAVQGLTNAVADVVNTQDGNVFGLTDVFIEGRREQVRTEETTLGNLTADANLAVAQSFDDSVMVSLKNGGGIRAAIGEIDTATSALIAPQANQTTGKNEGEISQLDIANALRFNNGLTLLTLTHEELKATLENGVSGVAPGATPGAFAQVSGMKFSYDASQAPGARIVNAAIVDDTGAPIIKVVEDGVVVDPAQTVRIVTLSFLADGGDGYPFDTLANAERVDLVGALTQQTGDFADFAAAGSEQDALAEFLAQNFPADALDPMDLKPAFSEVETAPEDDRRIQDVALVDQTDFFAGLN